jgi:hypothetical protein
MQSNLIQFINENRFKGGRKLAKTICFYYVADGELQQKLQVCHLLYKQTSLYYHCPPIGTDSLYQDVLIQ